MSRHNGVYQLNQWTKTVSAQMPHLTKSQAVVLALLSFSMAACRYCGLTTIAAFAAKMLHRDENSMYKRLREWYYDASDKSGDQRAEINPESCFTSLMRWIVRLWQGIQLTLVMDATLLADCFVVLSVSVAYRGFAIPVAWKILKANCRHPWQQEWLRLLDLLNPAIPGHFQVLVLTDRGLYAKWLFEHIKRLGWIPFMRINSGGYFLPENQQQYRLLSTFAPRPGTHWFGRGTAFKNKHGQLSCTLLAWWDTHSAEPWLIVSSISLDIADPGYYSLRAWIERGFRTTKRGGLGWHNTKMTDPQRASRLWIPISLALLWLASLGTQTDDADSPLIHFTSAPDSPILANHFGKRKRRLSIFRRGWIDFIISIFNKEFPPLLPLSPEPWPSYYWDTLGTTP